MSSTSCKPLWALVDCNNFFASCEKLFRPDLTDKPVVVLSNNDGCIVARSKEAKALQIPMGIPAFKVRPLLLQHKVSAFSSNYGLYGDISARVMATLEHVSPNIEQYSIDEAFVRLDGALKANAINIARTLREIVLQWTGITMSVGIASTRTLAKIANHLGKKGDGIFLMPEAVPEQEAVLRSFPVSEIWGIGKRHAVKCHEIGITNAFGLRAANDVWVRKNLTVTGWKTVLELRGIPSIGEGEAPTPRRTLVSSRSFGQKVYDIGSLQQAVATFTAKAAVRLRRENLVAGGIAVHIRTSKHGTGEGHDVSGQQEFLQPTADTAVLQDTTRRVLARLYKEGPAYAKAGIMLYELCPKDNVQGNLLMQSTPQQDKRRDVLMQALDTINSRFGRKTVHFGAEGLGNAAWHMRQEHCSPRFTTDWQELAKARCG